MQYAGNVLVFGAISPNDGDWYGGVSADEAEEFLTALTEIEVRVLLVDAGTWLLSMHATIVPLSMRSVALRAALSIQCCGNGGAAAWV